MQKRIDAGPSFNTKQLGVILVTFIFTVFAAGAWANSMHQGLEYNTAELVNIRTDLKQLGEVAVLKAQIEALNKEVNRLQIRLDNAPAR